MFALRFSSLVPLMSCMCKTLSNLLCGKERCW